MLLGEARTGRRQRAILERRRDGRSQDQLFEVALAFADPTSVRDQTPRRAVGLHRLIDRQPRFLELGLEGLANLRSQSGQPTGGQLFRANFKQ